MRALVGLMGILDSSSSSCVQVSVESRGPSRGCQAHLIDCEGDVPVIAQRLCSRIVLEVFADAIDQVEYSVRPLSGVLAENLGKVLEFVVVRVT